MSTGLPIYFYVGMKGYNEDYSKYKITQNEFNGGGKVYHDDPGGKTSSGEYTQDPSKDVSASGGGATDARLVSGDWDLFNSLKSRIIVAGGGGGNGYWAGNKPGWGGGLAGCDAYGKEWYMHPNGVLPKGGSQTSGGTSSYTNFNGSFGKGGIGKGDYDGGGGGGGGYYGGAGGDVDNGAGGSSFISGYTGCNAIAESSTESNIVHTGQPNHYSGYVFTNGVMKAGNELMPSPSGGTETGHTGNGFAKITWTL